MKTTVRDIYKDPSSFKGKNLILNGWIRTLRDSKKIVFIELNDGSFFKNVQIVIEEGKVDNFNEIAKLYLSSAITIEGELVFTPNSKQEFEINANNVIIEGKSTEDYPLQKKRHTFEYMRTIAHLRPRANTFNATFRVRSVLAYAIHKFFQERNFIYCHSPIITNYDGEGAGEMFHVSTFDFNNIPKNEDGTIDYSKDFFNDSTNLTVTGQLEGEAFAHAYRNIYTFGPTFRAENSNTPRHAAEFWMIEPEIAFADLNDDMNLAEDMMKYIINYVLEKCPEEMEFFNSFVDNNLLERLKHVVSSDFDRMTYTEAVNVLLKSEKNFKFPVKWGVDLQTEHERYITEEVLKKPVFITDYPKEIKAFYMRNNDDNKTVAATDLLVPGVGEIIGGSQREERLDILEEKMRAMNLDMEAYWWYLDLRKYGGTKHAGYGLGFERALMYITGMANIRDVVPFPRTVGFAEF